MKSSILLSLVTLMSTSLAASLPNPFPSEEQWVEILPAPLNSTRREALEPLTLVPRQGSCTFQAFTGQTCSQPAGGIVTNPNRCVDTRNRHSFFIGSGCTQGVRVSIQENTGCPGGNNGGIYGPGCYNVNTGRNWQSSYVARV